MRRCQFQIIFASIGDDGMNRVSYEDAPEPIRRIRQGVVRNFAEHGYEVSFVADDVFEVQVEEEEEVEQIVNEVMEQNGCRLMKTDFQDTIGGLYEEPDFFGDNDDDPFDTNPNPDWWN